MKGFANGDYILVPLATFANSYSDSILGDYCEIFVEYLDPSQPQSTDVILGAMFF